MQKISSQQIAEKLFTLQDKEYQKFQAPLIPNIKTEIFIGVRTPELRKLAKELYKNYDCSEFLQTLPHKYFDENQLHGFLICEEKDFEKCLLLTESFLPYVNNWATCDQLSPKCFAKNTEKLLPFIKKWLSSDKTYTVRFSIKLLMQHFLDDKFSVSYPQWIAGLCRPATPLKITKDEEYNNYYINMMISWYFATALAKQWNSVIPFLQERKLNEWCHKKTIQKSKESFRITDEQKKILCSLNFKV